MSNSPRPKKKSRFFDQLKWFPRPNSSKTADRPKTPPKQSKILVPTTEGQAPPPPRVQIPKFHPSSNPQPVTHPNPLAAPTQLEQNLISPRTATAAAFHKLSVEDHQSKGTSERHDSIHQAQAGALGNATRDITRWPYPNTCPSQAAGPLQVPIPQTGIPFQGQQHVVVPGIRLDATTSLVAVAKTNPQHLRGIQISESQKIHPQNPQAIGRSAEPRHPVLQRPANHINAPNRPLLASGVPTSASSDIRPHGKQIADNAVPVPAPLFVPHNYKPETPPFYPRSTNYYHHCPTYTTTLNTRKRKRQNTSLLPPPAYIYIRTNNPHFNIFSALLLYPELCYHLALHLPITDLVSLYAISRDYHTILDTRFTTLIVSLAEYLTPNAFKVFPFRCYAHLCRPDPAARIPHPDPKMAEQGVVRKIPSFKWLQMLLHREKVVHEIMTLAAERGVPFPRRCKQVLLKFWFMLDIPDNARRVGYIHNERLFGELDLYFGMCVVVRLDMLFNDPVGTEKRDGGRRLVLAQRSLTCLLLVLRGQIWTSKTEVLGEWVRWKYDPRDEDRDGGGEEGIFGVPLEECGSLKKQWWGEKRRLEGMKKKMRENGEEGEVLWLLRPDQLIVREVVRRGLRFQKHALKCMLYGFVDPRTLSDVDWGGEGKLMSRREKGLEGHSEYDFGDLVGGARCVDLPDGGDRLLDLGKKAVRSRRCMSEGVGEQERKWRDGEREFTRKCYAWWQQEIAEAGVSEEEMSG